MKTFYHTLRWRLLAKKLKRKSGFKCQECRIKTGALETHHIKPVKEGGDFWSESNLIVLCRKCHVAKHRKKIDEQYEEWIKFRDELR